MPITWLSLHEIVPAFWIANLHSPRETYGEGRAGYPLVTFVLYLTDIRIARTKVLIEKVGPT